MTTSWSIEALTREVMGKALDGNHPVLEACRKQYAEGMIVDVEGSGAGLFVVFRIPDTMADRPNMRFQITDVSGNLAGLKNGFGTVLFIDSGKLRSLEFYTYEERWPEELDSVTVFYDNGARDWDKLAAAIASGLEQ